MRLESVPACRMEESGVSFKYLVFRLKSGEAEKQVLRGVNFQPYEADANRRIERQLRAELERLGFDPRANGLSVLGGGTISVNPYYETVTVFGENPEHGAEPDRSATLALLSGAFAGYEVKSYEAGEEEAPPKPKKKPVRKAAPRPAAAKPAAAAKVAPASAAPAASGDEEPEPEDEPDESE